MIHARTTQSLTLFACSDLHLNDMNNGEMNDFEFPEADLYLIAGDTANGVHKHFCDWLIEKTNGVQTLLIPGNHDYEQLTREEAISLFNQFLEGSSIKVLQDSYAEIAPGLAVYGTDYWTDLALDGDIDRAMEIGRRRMSDYQNNYVLTEGNRQKLTPEITAQWHEQAKQKIAEFAESYSGQYILMTHHGVFRECLPKQPDGQHRFDELDPLMVSDGSAFIEGLPNRPVLCINGHFHRYSYQQVGRVAVYANPRGNIGSLNPVLLQAARDTEWTLSLKS